MRRELTAAAGAGAYVPSTGKGHPKSALDQHCKKKIYIYICIYIYIPYHIHIPGPSKGCQMDGKECH